MGKSRGRGRRAHIRWRSCGRKQKHSKSDAHKVALQLHKKDGADMCAYKCTYSSCRLADGQRSWHVGHWR